MKLFRAMLLAGMVLLLLGGWQLHTASVRTSVQAQFFTPTPTPTGQAERPPRITKIRIPIVSHKWWLIRYSNNWIECAFSIEHEGLPTGEDIQANCTDKLYEEWQETKPCDIVKVDTYSQCPGFYLQPVGSTPGEREIEIELPDPTVWVSVTNCNPRPPDMRCTALPNLLLTGEEPLPNESIINIQGTIAGEPFSCPGAICSIPLKPTGMDGIVVEFWADSSFGDSTERFTARVRLVPWGDFTNPEARSNDPTLYYVDVLSDRWRDGELATCTDTWQVFPSIGGPPEWLTSPESPEELESDISYYYLAGALITHGVVDASGCLDGGLQAPNIANPCGVEAARPQLVEWQNRFDGEILQVSKDTGVPARLLKNVFSRESQIWPGIFTTYKEAGLGQLTDNGADTILLWNPDFFRQFCPLVLDKKYCELGWGNLGEFEQGLLRGSLVNQVNASCPGCPAGIDISEANYSVRVFAEGMLANCEQVGRIITNLTELSPGQTSSYEDLWRFTLVNYNAGPGCLADAIQRTWFANQPLNWPSVSSYLEPACQGAIGYVEDISRTLKATPTPTVWLRPGELVETPVLPRVVVTPTPPQARVTPTVTPTRTPGTVATAVPSPTLIGAPTLYPYPYPTYPAYP